MHFTHDPNADFYYMGEEEPSKELYRSCFVNSKPSVVGIDVETISLKERIAIGVSIALKPKLCFYFQLFPEVSPAVPWSVLKDPTITKVIHNAPFDLSALREYEVDNTNIIDSSIIARLLCFRFADLLSMGVAHQMEVHDMKEILEEHKAKTCLEVPQSVMARKCMQDSGACLKLYEVLYPKVDKDYLAVEMQTIPIMIEMSNIGLAIDQEMRAEVEEQLDDNANYYAGLCENIGFKPSSPQQVSWTLANRGAYSIFTRLPFTRGKYGRRTSNLSSSRATLEKMDDPLASIVLKWRDNSYLLSHYIRPWSHDDRAYTRFHLDAITGRPSSTDRNMQNIPGKKLMNERGVPNCRNILIPDSGVWTDVDWSQLELRLLAYLSQDREMLHIYETGGDIHQTTADFLGIPRAFAKNVNFALVYGATDETLMETAHIRSIERARQLRQNIFQLFSGVGDWIDAQHHQSTITHRARTIFGRDIRLPTEDEERVDGIHRKAVNYPIQGSAAEILKRGLIACKHLPMYLQVHDEILCDGFIPDYTFKVLEDIAPIHTPVEVKYLTRWE